MQGWRNFQIRRVWWLLHLPIPPRSHSNLRDETCIATSFSLIFVTVGGGWLLNSSSRQSHTTALGGNGGRLSQRVTANKDQVNILPNTGLQDHYSYRFIIFLSHAQVFPPKLSRRWKTETAICRAAWTVLLYSSWEMNQLKISQLEEQLWTPI